jgi:hypothetical protein
VEHKHKHQLIHFHSELCCRHDFKNYIPTPLGFLPLHTTTKYKLFSAPWGQSYPHWSKKPVVLHCFGGGGTVRVRQPLGNKSQEKTAVGIIVLPLPLVLLHHEESVEWEVVRCLFITSKE